MPPSLRISVVINHYNYAEFIGEAVASVYAQTRPADQVVIVDDGSRDHSPAVLRALQIRHPDLIVITQDNAGQLAALQTGTAKADADVVAYLDADDRWDPDYLAELDRHYRDHPSIDFIAANLRYFGARAGCWSPRTEDRDYGLSVLVTRFAGAWIGAPTSALSMRLPIARAALDVPARLREDWRTRADDVLIIGSSLAGACKRSLAIPKVEYRIHSRNAWSGREPPGAVQRARHDWRTRRLVAYYSHDRGLDDDARQMIRHEFRTVPKPTRADWWQACLIAWRAPVSLGRRLELVVSLTRDWLRTMRGRSR